MTEISGPPVVEQTVVPTRVGGYQTVLFTWPPYSMFAEGRIHVGVFTGVNPDKNGVGKYATWMVYDGYVPGSTPESERWVGEEGLYAGNILGALEHHERYVRRIVGYFKES